VPGSGTPRSGWSYSLTELGRELVDPIATIRDWAVAHMERVNNARELYNESSGAP